MALTELFRKKDDEDTTESTSENTTRYYSSMDRFRSSFGGSGTNGDSGSGSNSTSNNTSNSSHSGYSNYLYHLNNPIQKTTEKTNRGVMDRILGTLGYTGVVEGLYNLADDDPNSTFISGLGEGMKYMNPFTDDVSGRHTFSDVLEEAGWKDKEDGKLNIGRAVAGLAGDILLDPITYLNPFSALSKVAKGSGVGTDVIKGLSDVSKAEDIVKEVKAVTGGVNNVNISHIKALDKKGALKIVTDNIYTARNGKASLWTPEEINKMADDLMISFNTKIQHLSRGGGDGLTIGFNNMPFSSKIKIGGRQLDTFKKTLLTNDQLATLGDRTVAPYLNDLAKKLRTSRWGKRFSKNAELEDLAKTNFDEAVKRYFLRELESGILRTGLDSKVFATSNVFRKYYESLNKSDQEAFLDSLEKGQFFEAETTKQLIQKIKAKYGVDYTDEYDNVVKALQDAQNEFIADFDKASGRTKIKDRRADLEKQGYYDLAPIRVEYATDDEFRAAKKAWQQRNPNKSYNSETYLYKDSTQPLSDAQKRNYRMFGEAAGKLDKQYGRFDGRGKVKIELSDDLPYYPTSPNMWNEAIAHKTQKRITIDSKFLSHSGTNFDDAVRSVEKARKQGLTTSHVGDDAFSNIRSAESIGLHESSHLIGATIKNRYPAEWSKIIQLYNKHGVSSKNLITKNVSKRAADNYDEFFTEMFSDIIIHHPKTKEAQEFRNIVESVIGKKIEDWKSLRFLNDDNTLKLYEDEFKKYSQDFLGKEHDWWESIDDIEKEFMSKLGYSSDEVDLMNKIHSGYNSLKYVERFGNEGKKVAKLWAEEMKKVAQREVDAGFLSKKQAAAWANKYVPHFDKERMAKFRGKSGFALSEEDMKVLEDLVHRPMDGAFDPDILGTLNRFDQHRNSDFSINEINANAGKEILETSLADLYLARVLGSNKLMYGGEVQNFLKKNFLVPLGKTNVAPNGRVSVALYKDVEKGINKYTSKIKNPDKRDKVKENIISNFVKLGDTNFNVTYSPNNVLQMVNEKQIRFLRQKGIEVYHASMGVVKDANTVTRTQKAQMTSSFMKTYDKFLNIWKLQNTVVTPGFHYQNLVSNAFQSFLAIGSDAFNVSKIAKAQKIFNNPDPKQTIKIGKKVWTYQELNYVARKTGIIDEMFHVFEFSENSKGGLIKGLPPSLDPTDTEKFLPYKLGTKLGGNIEGIQRLNLFISALKQTDNDIKKASEIVNKFLFDYSDITEFEQDIVKRIIPFYTFMKKNFPMELEQMIEQPTTYTMLQKLYTNFEKSGSNEYYGENDRNDWRQEHIQMPFTFENGDTYGITDQMPYNQIERLVDPQKLLGQTSPILKTPIEIGLGKYAYTGADIKNTGEYLANQTFWSKLPVVSSSYDDPIQKRNYIIGQLMGFPIGKINTSDT